MKRWTIERKLSAAFVAVVALGVLAVAHERQQQATASQARSQATFGLLATLVSATLVGAVLLVRHHLAEQRRAESERDRFFTLALDMLCIAGTDGYFKRLNPAFTDTLGYPLEELLGRPFLDLVHPEDQAATLREVERLAAGQRVVHFENRYRHRDGSWRWLSWRAMPEPGGLIYATARDVTRQKRIELELQGFNEGLEERVQERTAELVRAQESLRGEEARRRALFEALPDMMFLQSADGIYLDCHAPDVSALILPPEGFLGRPMREVLPPDLVEKFEPAFAEALVTGRTQVVEYCLGRDAAAHHFEARIAPCEGQLLVSVVRDITQRKQAEEGLRRSHGALQEAQLRYERASEVAKVGVWDWNLDSDEIYVDPALKALLGFADGEIRNHYDDWSRRIHPEDVERVAEARAHLNREKPFYEVERRMLHKDGSVRWFLARGVAAWDGAGRPVRLVGADLDVTERRRLEGMLQHSQKLEAVGRLAGGVAHDFNNILGVITGYGELALRQLGPEHPVRGRLEQIVKAAARAAGLTRQLLAFSRRQILQPRALDLNALVADLDSMLRRVIGEDVELETRQFPGLGSAMADPTQVEQVILNLVVNARDAMPKGGHLTIETANADFDEASAAAHPPVRAGRFVMISVSDTGIGMDAETQRRVFEPFFTTKPPGQGTGLGLATVYGVVEQSGGHIWVYSEPGRGATFKVYLPRVDGPASPSHGPEPGGARRGDETVLLVEDTESLREVIREVLEQQGYTVLRASHGEDALAVATSHEGPIALLLTDLVMPKLGGADLARQLAASRPGMRVLYMSGYTDGAISRQGVLREGAALLEKPFTGERLARAVREALDRPARG